MSLQEAWVRWRRQMLMAGESGLGSELVEEALKMGRLALC